MQTSDLQLSEQGQRRRVGAITRCLAQCLRHLDAVDDGLAAVHLSMALDTLRRDYHLDRKT